MLVNEIFLSVQGEGIFAGTPAFFVRLQGCPLRCSFCDTKKAQDESAGTPMHVEEICEYLRMLGTSYPLIKTVIVTGGEPLYGDNGTQLRALVRLLCNKGYKVHIESSGTVTQPWLIGMLADWNSNVHLTISPKFRDEMDTEFMEVDSDLVDDAAQIKFVVGGSAINEVRVHSFVHKHNLIERDAPICVQPIDYGKDHPETKLAILRAMEMVKKYNWLLSYQMHKCLNIA